MTAALAVLGSVLTGIGIAHFFQLPELAVGFGCGVLFAGLLFRYMIIVLLAFFLLAGGLTGRSLEGLSGAPLQSAYGQEVVVRGSLIADPVVRSYTAGTILRTQVIILRGREIQLDRRIEIVASDRPLPSEFQGLYAGDEVSLRGTIAPFTGNRQYQRSQHIVATMRATRLIAFTENRSALWGTANWLRERVERGTATLNVNDRALLQGFLLGDTADISKNDYLAFRNAGMSHLLAVSGANVAFVLSLCSPVLRRLALHSRTIGALGVIAIFAAATRFEPSVLRASVMAALSVWAVHIGRPQSAVRIWMLGVTALLLIDPMLVWSTAFRLSAAASGGIVLFSDRVARRIPLPSVLGAAISTTVAAQIAVTPLLLVEFGKVPVVGLVSNLIASPLSAPLTSWGLAVSLSLGFFGLGEHQVAIFVQFPTILLVRAERAIAYLSDRVPIAVTANTLIPTAVLAGIFACCRMLALHGRYRPFRRVASSGANLSRRMETTPERAS